MTTTIKLDYGTPFSHWLREQNALDSHEEKMSFTNIDFMCEGPDEGRTFYSRYRRNVKKGEGLWMLLEEKQHLSNVREWQLGAFMRLHNAIVDKNYRGFHLIQFENTNPDDGCINLDGVAVGRIDLLEFLRFEKPETWYQTHFLTNLVKNLADVLPHGAAGGK